MRLLNAMAVLFVTVSAGCGYVHNLRYEIAPTSADVSLTDKRPTQDKVDTPPREPLPYSGYVVGDEHFSPDRVSILRNRLATEVGTKLQGKQVVLTRLHSLNINTRPTNLDVLISGARPVSTAELGIASSQQFRYWIICEIAIVVDGATYYGRGFDGYSGPLVDYPGHHRKALMTAIDQIVAQL